MRRNSFSSSVLWRDKACYCTKSIVHMKQIQLIKTLGDAFQKSWLLVITSVKIFSIYVLFLYFGLNKQHTVQFSRSVMSDSLRPHELQHARPSCPSPTPGVYSNSCPSSQLCHPTISTSVVPFFSCLQSFPASGSFQMSQLFASGGQSIGVSVSISVIPMNTQGSKPN